MAPSHESQKMLDKKVFFVILVYLRTKFEKIVIMDRIFFGDFPGSVDDIDVYEQHKDTNYRKIHPERSIQKEMEVLNIECLSEYLHRKLLYFLRIFWGRLQLSDD